MNILSQSACSTCHAKGACTVADIQEKEIEISNFSKNYTTGQEVTVVFQQSQGYIAVFWGYVMPFILVLITLIAANLLIGNELMGGLLSLAVLIPYYFILYVFRNKMKRKFTFEIEENS